MFKLISIPWALYVLFMMVAGVINSLHAVRIYYFPENTLVIEILRYKLGEKQTYPKERRVR
jgi:hypothetical protein